MFCRCRPDNTDEHVVSFLDEDTVSCPTMQGKEKKFEFDKVFDPSATQEEVRCWCVWLCLQRVLA